MSLKNIIAEIDSDVLDVTGTSFEHVDTDVVPRSDDGQLTYERGQAKKGKKITTCVLYVDIRNSVALTEKHQTQTMGRIYTAFTKAVLKVARHHNGHIRNIIGDRIMIVFPSKNCFTNAVDCAISINHIAHFVIKKKFSNVDFKCGIGIDYGDLRVIKVGIQRNGTEHSENKGLVWVGYPANIASRLTDIANKEVEQITFEITKRYYRPINTFLRPISDISPFLKLKRLPEFFDRIESITSEEFLNLILSFKNGTLDSIGSTIVNFHKNILKFRYPNILMTEKVYKGFKSANSQRNSIRQNLWVEQKHEIKNVKSKVYGSNLIWNFSPIDN